MFTLYYNRKTAALQPLRAIFFIFSDKKRPRAVFLFPRRSFCPKGVYKPRFL